MDKFLAWVSRGRKVFGRRWMRNYLRVKISTGWAAGARAGLHQVHIHWNWWSNISPLRKYDVLYLLLQSTVSHIHSYIICWYIILQWTSQEPTFTKSTRGQCSLEKISEDHLCWSVDSHCTMRYGSWWWWWWITNPVYNMITQAVRSSLVKFSFTAQYQLMLLQVEHCIMMKCLAVSKYIVLFWISCLNSVNSTTSLIVFLWAQIFQVGLTPNF